jgi:hypothetical protein
MNKNTKIIWKAIDELIPYEHNAKEHTEKQLANLEESFRRYGWQQPCLITNDNVIITGHGRALGAKRAGLTDAPCIYCDDLTEKEIKEYRHLDNLLSDGDYIQSELEFELPELDFSDFDLELDLEINTDIPVNLEKDRDDREDFIIRLTFQCYEDYLPYESDFKNLAEKTNAKIMVGAK